MGGVQTPATLDFNEAEYQRINTWLRNRSGMIFLDNKKESLMLRMNKVRETYLLPDLNALATALEKGQNADLETAVIHAASTNHTYFFRELSVLNYFQASILPELPITNVRIWSAAASTGDEAYSIAMIAAQTRGLDWAKKQLAILGTDISELVIAHAEKGIYGGLHVDKTPPEYLDYGFDPVGMNQYRVKQQFQQMCTFRRLNNYFPLFNHNISSCLWSYYRAISSITFLRTWRCSGIVILFWIGFNYFFFLFI